MQDENHFQPTAGYEVCLTAASSILACMLTAYYLLAQSTLLLRLRGGSFRERQPHWVSDVYLVWSSASSLDFRFSVFSISYTFKMVEKIVFVILGVLCSIAFGKFDNITSTRTSYVTVTATESSGTHKSSSPTTHWLTITIRFYRSHELFL